MRRLRRHNPSRWNARALRGGRNKRRTTESN
jgi:hypothetical protein